MERVQRSFVLIILGGGGGGGGEGRTILLNNHTSVEQTPSNSDLSAQQPSYSSTAWMSWTTPAPWSNLDTTLSSYPSPPPPPPPPHPNSFLYS